MISQDSEEKVHRIIKIQNRRRTSKNIILAMRTLHKQKSRQTGSN